jgi:hypothetical protein
MSHLKDFCGIVGDGDEGVRARGNDFSKVLYIVTLHRKYTWVLTFENMWQAAARSLTLVASADAMGQVSNFKKNTKKITRAA